MKDKFYCLGCSADRDNKIKVTRKGKRPRCEFCIEKIKKIDEQRRLTYKRGENHVLE
jgi:hypothetical protein